MVPTVPSRTPRRIPWTHDAHFQDRPRRRHGMTLPPRSRAAGGQVRVRLRRGTGRRLAGAGPGQPDRRAHRLQRGLRAALRDRQDGPGWRSGSASGLHRSGCCPPSATRGCRRPMPRALAPRHRQGLDQVSAGVVWACSSAASTVRGLDLLLDSDVPLGAGLSSSHAIECAVITALNELTGAGLGAEEMVLADPARGKRLRRRTHRHHGPVRVAARRQRARRLPRLPGPDRASSSRSSAEAAGLVLLVIDTKVVAFPRRRRLRLPPRVLRARRRGPRASRPCGTSASGTWRRPAACWIR